MIFYSLLQLTQRLYNVLTTSEIKCILKHEITSSYTFQDVVSTKVDWVQQTQSICLIPDNTNLMITLCILVLTIGVINKCCCQYY